jgi:hypothetical protein
MAVKPPYTRSGVDEGLRWVYDHLTQRSTEGGAVSASKEQLARLDLWVRICRVCANCGQYSVVLPSEDAKELKCACGGTLDIEGVYMSPDGYDL